MPTLTRRGLFAAAAATAAALQAKTLKKVGVQLYTLRSIIDAEPAKTLEALEKIGYREAEVIRGNMDKIWPSLLKTKLKPVSIHMDTALFTKKQSELGPALDDAKKRGFKYVVCPYIAPADRGGVDVIKKLAETLNRAGEKCHSNGLMLCYHNHAFEFEPFGGKTLLDVLMAETDKRYVGLELDIMWSSVAGVDPVSVLKQYAGRVPLMHLKNKASGTEKLYKETVPKTRVQGSWRRRDRHSRCAARFRTRRREALLRRAGSDAGQSARQPAQELRVHQQTELLTKKWRREADPEPRRHSCLLRCLSLVRLQDLLPQPDRLRRHFHQLILANEFERLLQVQQTWRNQPDRFIRA